MEELMGESVILRDGELLRRSFANRKYLMSLKDEHLLRNYELEAGRFTNRCIDTETMGGWESSTCQLRGHFLGHYLSAAAMYYNQTGDIEIKAKADAIVDELGRCQEDNGGEWAAGIPEKYLYWIAKGRPIWAPQYTIHKTFMGLVDMYKYAGNKRAIEIADKFADWFYDWSGKYSREKFDDILDYETSGMLEVWADLYDITKKDKYKTLIERYYRSRLFDALLAGKDALTNMHANTTIPEILGCARCYEVLGDEKYLNIVKAYYKCAVTDRGTFATGGSTQGEIWQPMMKLKNRLGDKNQELCTVYNMRRLADFLFLQTHDPKYLQYMEYNLYNGIMAQSYYFGVEASSGNEEERLYTYFLPMAAGSRKNWAGPMDSFFCCCGTMVQANASFNHGIFYEDGKNIYIGQYINSDLDFNIDGNSVRLSLFEDSMNGLLQESSENNTAQTVNDIASAYANRPPFRKYVAVIHAEEGKTVDISLNFRIPEWINGKAVIMYNDEKITETGDSSSFVAINRKFKDGDRVTAYFPIGIKFIPMPDDPSTGAFRFGPEVLVGLTDDERFIHTDKDDEHLYEEFAPMAEREWGTWLPYFRTLNQEPGIKFVPINKVGDEKCQMYFKIKR